MSDDTAGKKIEAGNPRDAFTAEHQRMAWEIAVWAVRRAFNAVCVDSAVQADVHKVHDFLECARLAQQIATGAL